MADMGFLPQVRAILDLTPADGQRLLFSATLDGEVAHAGPPLPAPTRSPARSPRPPRRWRRWSTTCCIVDTAAKPRVVTEIAARDGRTILFVRTKHGVDRLVKTLRRDGVDAGALHGGKAQNARNRAIADVQGRAHARCWWPPTSPRAASTSTTSASSSTSTRPPTRRTTCTAPAAPRGPATRAPSSRMVTPPERRDVDRLTRLAGVRATADRGRSGRRRAEPDHRRPPAVRRADRGAAQARAGPARRRAAPTRRRRATRRAAQPRPGRLTAPAGRGPQRDLENVRVFSAGPQGRPATVTGEASRIGHRGTCARSPSPRRRAGGAHRGVGRLLRRTGRVADAPSPSEPLPPIELEGDWTWAEQADRRSSWVSPTPRTASTATAPNRPAGAGWTSSRPTARSGRTTT